MRPFILLPLILLFGGTLFAQKQTFDVTTYSPPEGWKMDTVPGMVSYTRIDKDVHQWCMIYLTKGFAGAGSIDADFKNAWEELVTNPYKTTAQPKTSPIEEEGGWKIKAGGSRFMMDTAHVLVMLTTFSSPEISTCVVAIMNNDRYLKDTEKLIGSIEMAEPAVTKDSMARSAPKDVIALSTKGSSGFSIGTTRWDDGWTSVEKSDWVEATRNNTKVLIHYPNEVTTKYHPDSDVELNEVWDRLAAPRYRDLTEVKKWFNLSNIPRPLIVTLNARELSTGRFVHVALYHRGDSNIPWIEVVSPDRNSFIREFGVDINTLPYAHVDPVIFKALEAMTGYNRFPASMEDLTGTWKNSNSSTLEYYNTNTGLKTGDKTYASSQIFDLSSNGAFRWELNTAESSGSSKLGRVVHTGTFSLAGTWQLRFTDTGKKTKVYNYYFSSIKDGRLLWLQDSEYGDYNPFRNSK
jgi:hypothetical protein